MARLTSWESWIGKTSFVDSFIDFFVDLVLLGERGLGDLVSALDE